MATKRRRVWANWYPALGDAALTFDRMLAEAHDLDAQWTAARLIRDARQRLAWMRAKRFNVGESW